MSFNLLKTGLISGLMLTSLTAMAAPDDPDPNKQTTVGEGQPTEALPPSQSDHDAQPQVASPVMPDTGVVEQAGVGGVTAYGRTGVLELGGNLSFTHATDNTFFTMSPSLGWFFMDNVEVSALFNLTYFKSDTPNPTGTGSVSTDGTIFTFLLEPSLHIPFTQTMFGMAGVGLGASYIDGPGAGFAVAPRLGVNFLVGRSGILTPAFVITYATNDAISTPQGTVVAVNASYGLQIGYTVMW